MTKIVSGGYNGSSISFDSSYVSSQLAPNITQVLIQTELGGNSSLINKFSYAGNGNSGYSFGVYQFDVRTNPAAANFLQSIGFTSSQISELQQSGGLSASTVNALSNQLQTALQNPANQAALNTLNNSQTSSLTTGLQTILSDLWLNNPSVAQQITESPDLQLRIIDYFNQFGYSESGSMAQWLAGNQVTQAGGVQQIAQGSTLTSNMIDSFVMGTQYAVSNPTSEQSRLNRLDSALSSVDTSIGPSYIDLSGSCVNPYTLDGVKVRLLDSANLEIDGIQDIISLGSNDKLSLNTGISNPFAIDGPTLSTVSAMGSGNTLTTAGVGSLSLNSTGITSMIGIQTAATVTGTGVVDLTNGVSLPNPNKATIGNPTSAEVTIAAGADPTIGGNGTVEASFGTFQQAANSTVYVDGSSENVKINAGDITYVNGTSDIFTGTNSSGGYIVPYANSVIDIQGYDIPELNYSNVGVTESNVSVVVNTSGLTGLDIYGSNDSLSGTGSNDAANYFGTYDTSSLGNAGLTYFGATTGDSYTGSNTSYTDIPSPDTTYFDPGFSEDDPIVLALNGGSVQTQNLTSSTAYFDVQNNGNKDHTGWGTAGEGYLVYDPLNKNTVTNEQSLVSSFAALRALDTNGDGVLNSLDSTWSSLKVWVDSTGNASFSAGSLKTLSQLGITSINLNATHVNKNQNNNTILDDSTFTWASGSTGDIAGVDMNFHASTVVNPVRNIGGGGCVQILSILPDGKCAGDVTVGSAMLLADEKTLLPGAGVVSYSERKRAKGYRVVAEGGYSLVCSDTAPIPTPNGCVLAPDLMGHTIAVRKDEAGCSLAGWAKVLSVIPVGEIDIQHITVGDKCFWAGEKQGFYILHHNTKMLP